MLGYDHNNHTIFCVNVFMNLFFSGGSALDGITSRRTLKLNMKARIMEISFFLRPLPSLCNTAPRPCTLMM